MVQVVEHLPSMHKTLSSNPSPVNRKENKNKKLTSYVAQQPLLQHGTAPISNLIANAFLCTRSTSCSEWKGSATPFQRKCLEQSCEIAAV
jgi:hypothetical protein